MPAFANVAFYILWRLCTDSDVFRWRLSSANEAKYLIPLSLSFAGERAVRRLHSVCTTKKDACDAKQLRALFHCKPFPRVSCSNCMPTGYPASLGQPTLLSQKIIKKARPHSFDCRLFRHLADQLSRALSDCACKLRQDIH